MNPMKDCSSCGVKDPVADVLNNGGKSAQYFHYSTPLTVVPASGFQVFNIPIYPDSYFVVKKLVSTQTGNLTARLVNGATGRYFQNLAIQNASFQTVWPTPSWSPHPPTFKWRSRT